MPVKEDRKEEVQKKMSQKTTNPKKRKVPSSTKSSKDESLSAKSRKQALKHERQSHRKHAEAVLEAKKIWNKLRQKNNSKDEVGKMMEDLMKLIRGKANEIALQHDASRVVQAALQFGSDEQRKEVLEELCKEGNLFELARNQYAHFVVLKAIKYSEKDDECIRMIVKVRAILWSSSPFFFKRTYMLTNIFFSNKKQWDGSH